MKIQSHIIRIVLCLVLVLVFSSCHRRSNDGVKRERALRTYKENIDATLPSVATLTGIQRPESVEVEILTRSELSEYLGSTLEIDYPNDELKKRGRCFAEMGLLPRHYDMTAGFLDLCTEAIGALYDPHTKTIKGIYGLAGERRRQVNDKMILSHELTHALQDRVVDITHESLEGLKNIDYEYAFRALVEGMASCVMIAFANNTALHQLPDLKTFWRTSLAQAGGGAFTRSPLYLREYLMSPYAEGGAFIQHWMKDNPDKKLVDLLQAGPVTSEQILHYDKYVRCEKAPSLDLSNARKHLPINLDLYYRNSLGEFDLFTLFTIWEATRDSAGAFAAGWNGCEFEAYTDQNDKLIIIGTSSWDSGRDAEEFYEGFREILREMRDANDFDIALKQSRVVFIVGMIDEEIRKTILGSLISAPLAGG